MATTPIMTTIIAWIFIGESLSIYSLAGISITISGITWTILEHRYKNNKPLARHHPDADSYRRGISLVPVAIIPVVVFVNKEKVSKRAILGAIVSVSGVAILMLS